MNLVKCKVLNEHTAKYLQKYIHITFVGCPEGPTKVLQGQTNCNVHVLLNFRTYRIDSRARKDMEDRQGRRGTNIALSAVLKLHCFSLLLDYLLSDRLVITRDEVRKV